MGEFIKKNNKYYRNNSDGSQHEVTLGSDGHFHWVQPDGQHVRSVSKAETYFKPSIWDSFKTALRNFGAYSVTSEPGGSAIQTSEGTQINNDGSFTYNKPTEGSEQLRKINGMIGLFGLAGYGGGAALSYIPAIVPEITIGQLPWWQTIIGSTAGSIATGMTADKISKRITGKTIGGNVKSGVASFGPAGQMYANIIPEGVWDFANPFYAVNPAGIYNTGVSFLNKSPEIVRFLRHPTYRKYYHGTSADFNLRNANMGSEYNSGLHVSGDRRIAESMKDRGGGTNPRVEELWAPKPSTETIDVGDNGIRQLSSKYVIEPRTNGSYYDAAGDNTFKFNLIKEAGGNPVMIEGKPAFQIETPVTLNLRKSSYPNIPESRYLEIDDLLHRYQSQTTWNLDALSTQTRRRLANINKKAAEIMSESGYKVVKYNNTNPYEGGGGTSYFITDPSVIYQHTPFQTFNYSRMWTPVITDED